MLGSDCERQKRVVVRLRRAGSVESYPLRAPRRIRNLLGRPSRQTGADLQFNLSCFTGSLSAHIIADDPAPRTIRIDHEPDRMCYNCQHRELTNANSRRPKRFQVRRCRQSAPRHHRRGRQSCGGRRRQNRARVTVTIARCELRAWLRDSDEGRAVECAVGRLLTEDGQD